MLIYVNIVERVVVVVMVRKVIILYKFFKKWKKEIYLLKIWV